MSKIIDGISSLSKATDEIANPPKGVRVEGWDKFSRFTNGLRMHEFSILCGSTGSGKTALLACLANRLVSQGVETIVASVETGYTDFIKRMLASQAKFDFNTGIDPREFNQKEFVKYSVALKSAIEHGNSKFHNLQMMTYDNRVDIDELISYLKMANDIHNCKVALLDNLNFFMKPTSSNNQVLELDETVHRFVMLAKEIPIHIILVMHPKKTENGRVESEFDIKGSSTAVQESSNVILFNRLHKEDIKCPADNFKRELVFKKIRKNGYNVNNPIYYDFKGGDYVELP